jgi:hypothetical protein
MLGTICAFKNIFDHSVPVFSQIKVDINPRHWPIGNNKFVLAGTSLNISLPHSLAALFLPTLALWPMFPKIVLRSANKLSKKWTNKTHFTIWPL